MARDFDGATDRVDWASIFDFEDAPLSVSMWVYPDSVAINQYFFCVNTGANAGFVFWTDSVITAKISVTRVGGTNRVTRSDNNVIAVGSWQHLLLTDDGSDTAANTHIYVDNVEVGYVLTQDGVNQSAYNGTWSAGGRTSDDARNLNGRQAGLGVWDRVLTAGERAALSKGYSPLFFPDGRRFCAPLIRGINDRISGTAGVADGTTVVAHPPMIYPAPPSFPMAPVGAPPAAITMPIFATVGVHSVVFGGQVVR